MSGRILFVEDQEAFAIGVTDRLQSEGYDVERAATGDAAHERGRNGRFDCILLDVMLPGGSGFDICRDLRRDGVQTPILMLTARGEIADRVVGLKLGADDYLVKPFNPLELLARIEALIRRAAGRAAASAIVCQLGAVRIDLSRNEVTRNGRTLSLSRAEYRLLRYLLEHPSAIVSRDELLEKVWGLGAGVMSRTVDVHVASLRKKIEPDPRYPRHLITVKGLGYKIAL